MTAVPLGQGAYRRNYSGAPEIVLLNRWLEQNPANLREGSSVLGRPGTDRILTLDPGGYTGYGSARGNYALSGLFSDSLFTVVGNTLYRINQDMSVTTIEGVINGTGHPEVAWQKGAGYERLWIVDGLVLQFYSGTTAASGTMTLTGTVTNNVDTFEVGRVYYQWGTTFSDTDAGSVSNPFIVNPNNVTGPLEPIEQMILAINDAGTPGTDYSATIGGPNTLVTASTPDTTTPASHMVLTANAQGTGGNSITTTVTGGTALSFASATLINGGIDALQGCSLPEPTMVPSSICEVSSYVLVSIANTQQFYFILPGETTIDPLSFASKESSPDNITALRTLGDQVGIIGDKSFENWYATGNSLSPFAPIEGRVYARGAYSNTAVVVDDGIIIVGDDGRVYSVGFQVGDASDLGWGVTRISNNGIEERIRTQIRREAGLTP
jgi:hypothetical protein